MTEKEIYLLPIFDYADIIWGDRGNVALMEKQNSTHDFRFNPSVVPKPLRLEINLWVEIALKKTC